MLVKAAEKIVGRIIEREISNIKIYGLRVSEVISRKLENHFQIDKNLIKQTGIFLDEKPLIFHSRAPRHKRNENFQASSAE